MASVAYFELEVPVSETPATLIPLTSHTTINRTSCLPRWLSLLKLHLGLSPTNAQSSNSFSLLLSH